MSRSLVRPGGPPNPHSRSRSAVWALAAVVFGVGLPPAATAQPPVTPAGKGEKKTPLDKIDGYKRHTIEGFTLLVSDEVLNADTSEFERKPLDVLVLELRAVSGMMSPRALDVLRRLVIWVEWDEVHPLTTGRDGTAVAVYYGGHQLSLFKKGMHPLKAKTVTILRMKSLTREHQPKRDSGRCVLLHEIAHAVHDQLLGRSHAGIKEAYRQAMERKLYDRAQYLTTNESEFFAELTCAYFDQLHHHPRTREELKKHDPVSYKVLESVWGAAAKKVDPAALAKRPKGLAANGSDKFDLQVKLSDVRLGAAVHGPAFDPQSAANRVLLLGYWGGAEVGVLKVLTAVHEELSPYGVTIVVAPSFAGVTPEKVAEVMAERDVPFTAIDRALIRVKGTNELRAERPPHCLLFGPDGSCVFRGSAHDVSPHARGAVGRLLLAGTGRSELPGALKPAADALTGGQPLLSAYPKVAPLMRSPDPEVAAAAKAIADALLAPGRAELERANTLARTDPLEAFLLVDPLPARFKGTPVESRAEALASKLRITPPVEAELRARTVLSQIRKLDAALSGQAGSFNPADPKFRTRNAAALTQMRQLLEQLRKKYPKARATEQAGKIAAAYGVK